MSKQTLADVELELGAANINEGHIGGDNGKNSLLWLHK